MRDVAPNVTEWLAGGRAVAIARVVGMDGFGGRRAGEVLAVAGPRSEVGEFGEGTPPSLAGGPNSAATPPKSPANDERRTGSLLSGAADAALADSIANVLGGTTATLVDVPVGDAEAVTAGLACGGKARVLVQSAGALPQLLWDAIAARMPAVLATAVAGPSVGASVVVRSDGVLAGSVGDAAVDAVVVAAASVLLDRGRSPQQTIDTDAGPVLLEAVRPVPRALVLGHAELSHAIAEQGSLLGWHTGVIDERDSAQAAAAVADAALLGPVDALIVLSHDIAISAATLHAALTGRCGYVGALGSRHTQSARAQQLRTVHACGDDVMARIHGPIGLDIGARTPEETALAIFAEVIANRGGRTAGSLRSGSGPING